MPGAVRINDVCSGHGCFPPRRVLTGSSDVLVNGRGAVVLGSEWEEHRCGRNRHTGTSIGGSATVFVNGKPKVRAGDPISCGSFATSSSSDVLVG